MSAEKKKNLKKDISVSRNSVYRGHNRQEETLETEYEQWK